MNLELIAILATSLIEIAGLVIGWMAHDNGERLVRIEGIDAAVFLQGRQMREVLDEVRRIVAHESASLPRNTTRIAIRRLNRFLKLLK
jgi:Zn-dependent protease